jgi:glycosyltransferase involved in cell wall biosynthesis
MKSLESDHQLEFPVVSIIIMNYNYARFLPVAIESCLSQTYPKVEIIVVDDGSTDDSQAIISSFGDKIIHVFKSNGGQASALNAGFEASDGDIICLLDADDVFLPEKVEYVVNQFSTLPECSWVFTESAPIETNEIQLDTIDSLFSLILANSPPDQLEDVDFRNSVCNGKIPNFTPSTSNLSFSRALLSLMMPLPEVKGISGVAISDLYIKTLAVALGVGRVSKKNLGIYRFHNNYYTNLDLDKKRRIFGEINVSTGYWMSKNFNQLKQVSAKFFSKGYAAYLSSYYSKDFSADANCEQMYRDYLKSCSSAERIQIRAMVAYYYLRLRFKDFV